MVGLVQPVVRAVVFGLALLFSLALYDDFYSIHQDLAGSVLSGVLAVELGASFENYSIYFPPMERFWFSAAALIQKVSGLGADTAAIVMTVVCVFISVELAYRVRVQLKDGSVVFYVASFAALILLPIIFKNVFGLREHMVVLGLWPYLVSRTYSGNIGVRLRIAIGVWLGFTLLFKFLYSIVVALVELADAAAQRKIRSLFKGDALMAAAIVAAYLFGWLGLDPENREAINLMRSSIEANFVTAEAGRSAVINRLACVMAVVGILVIYRVPARIALIAFAGICGTVAVAYIQQRWYTHHLFPIVMGFVFCWWAATATARIPKLFHPVVALVLATVFLGEFQKTLRYQVRSDYLTKTLQSERISLTGKRVAIMTQHPSPYNQVIAEQGGFRWTPMMNIAYMAAELQALDAASQDGAVLTPEPRRMETNALHDQMLNLWLDYPPDIILLDRTHRWPLKHIDLDWLHVLSEDGQFQSIMERYKLALSHSSIWLSFEIYVAPELLR